MDTIEENVFSYFSSRPLAKSDLKFIAHILNVRGDEKMIAALDRWQKVMSFEIECKEDGILVVVSNSGCR